MGASFPDIEARLLAAREQDAQAWRGILADARVGESLPRVWACSEFVATACLRAPLLLGELVRGGELVAHATEDWFANDVRQRVGGANEAEVMESLRRFRKRHMVRIAWRDIAGWADLDETLRDLSALADACIGFACTYMYEARAAGYGVPRGADSRQPQQLMILAMGKLGGGELNFSSDIDLIL